MRTIVTINDINNTLTIIAIVVIAIADISFANRPTAWMYGSAEIMISSEICEAKKDYARSQEKPSTEPDEAKQSQANRGEAKRSQSRLTSGGGCLLTPML
jgi:hypothetical protein